MDQVTEPVSVAETPTAAEREAALSYKGGYLYRIDPAYDPNGRVPPEAVIGAWQVDASGQITGAFQKNPRYQPAPR